METVAKTVLITGCSSGIGRSTAIHFARLDWQVYATVRHQDDADKLMMMGYTNIQAELLDVDDEEQIHQLVAKIKQQNKQAGLDVLVNNAGIAEACPLEYASIEHLQKHFSTNVIAPMVITRACLPLLKKNRGTVINVSSGGSRLTMPLMGVYCASKAAINALSDALRIELSRQGIRTIVIEPGLVDTPMQEKISKTHSVVTRQLSTEGLHYYRPMIEKNLQILGKLKKNAIKPSKVAQLITRAVTQDESGKSNYTVGLDAKLMHLFEPVFRTSVKDRFWQALFRF